MIVVLDYRKAFKWGFYGVYMVKKSTSVVKRNEKVFHPRVQGLDRCFNNLGTDLESVPDDIKRQFKGFFMYLPAFGIIDEPIGTDSVEYRALVKNRTPHLVVRLILNNQRYNIKNCVLVPGGSKFGGMPIPSDYHKHNFIAARGRADEMVKFKNGREALKEYTFAP